MASIFVQNAKAQAILVFAAPIGAGCLAMFIGLFSNAAEISSPYFWIGLIAMLGGYGLLVRSKWDQVKSGDFFTWGLSPEAQRFRLHYILSYLFMIGGFVLALVSGLL